MSDMFTKLLTFFIVFALVITYFCFGDSTASNLSLDNLSKTDFLTSLVVSFLATCFLWETLLEDDSKYIDEDIDRDLKNS